jgi:hypothetical protein
MEMADIATPKVEQPSAGKGVVIAAEQIDPVSGLIQPAQIVPIEGISIVRRGGVPALTDVTATAWPGDLPQDPVIEPDMPPPMGDPAKPEPPRVPPPPPKPEPKPASLLPIVAAAAAFFFLTRK